MGMGPGPLPFLPLPDSREGRWDTGRRVPDNRPFFSY
jgi:hypothetical protein